MEFLTELSKEAISNLGELALKYTVKQFAYAIHHKKIIANLKEEHSKLEGVKEARQGWVDTKRMNREGFDRNIQQWLDDMADFENKEFQLISYHKDPPPVGSTFTEDIKSLESRRTIIKDVIEKLKDDKFKRISICGMGGVGKSTLVKELIKFVENKLFDKVVMAVVSQNPDYKNIQSQIADCLGLSLKSEDVAGRGREINQRMKEIDDEKTKLLVVLDDVWSELNFDWVGLPSRDNQKCSKILFTSRHEKECQKMGSQASFHVSVLLEDEAWYLFQAITGDVVYEPAIYPIAKQVSRECGGLPLAVVIVGKALENEKKLTTWEVAFEQLKNSQSSTFSDVHKFVYSRIELSLKFLGSSTEHKMLLMLCALFPEDFDILIESLLRHAMGLGLFKVVGETWKARNRVYSLVDDLKRCCLLLDSNVPGCVKMHDIVRDVVILVTFKTDHRFMVEYDIKRLKKERLNDISAISLILDETRWLEDNLEFPSLQLLQVQSNEEELPEHFFRGMKSLKVLSLQKLYIPKIPSLFEASTCLHTLQVEYCNVGDISIIGKELLHLEVLSFAHSNIKELPVEIGNLNVLRLLDLTNCNDLNAISDNVFIRLSQLEELYFWVDNFPWKSNDVAINELTKISHQLKVVEMKVRMTEIFVKDLDFNNIQKFSIYVGPDTYLQRSSYLESKILQISAIDYQSIKSILMISQLIKKCQILIIERVENLKNIVSQLLSDCPYLKDLRVYLCPQLEYLIDGTVHCNHFAQIYSLSLEYLPNLKEMCYTPDHHEVKGMMFSYLVKFELKNLPRFIGLNNATNLNELNQELSVATEITDSSNTVNGEKASNAKLFSSNWMKQFPKLETILLECCSSLEVVFDLDGYLKSGWQAQDLLFPQLTKIEISDLKNLSYVWGIAPHCVKGFQNLRFLTISNCASLKYVFTSAIVSSITNLEKLQVRSCDLMERIVVWSRDEEDDNKGHDATTISFNKLHTLSLSWLPKLVSICSDPLWLECPSLMNFDILDCPMLEIYVIPTHNDAKHENFNTMNSTNTKDVGFQSSKGNNSRSSGWYSAGCIPKFIHQGNSNKRNNKEASVTRVIQDHIPSVFEMNRKGKSHMPSLEDLCIVKCDLLDALLFLDEECNSTILSHMKTITIDNCDKLTTIIAKRGKREGMINSCSLLESLILTDLPNLVRFCYFETYESLDKPQYMDESIGDHKSIRRHSLIDESFFPNLTSLIILACNKINILFSHSSISSLEHLQMLVVRNCENMEEIISHQEEIEASANKISIPALQHLHLVDLPNLKDFFKGHSNLDFPSLQEVNIGNCPNMELFSRGSSNTPNLEHLTIEINSLNYYCAQKKDINIVIQGFKAFVASQGFKMLNWTKLHNDRYFFRNSEIDINEFHKLLMLVPYNEIHMFQHVKKLTLSNCDSLVEVFGSGGEDTKEGDDTTHYQLQEMTLQYLPKLSHIWKHNITKVVSFQNLKDIIVSDCHNLKSLLSHSMAKSLLQLQKLVVEECEMMEEIITKGDEYIKEGKKVKTLFPKLEKLKLHHLPKLECVCLGDYDYDIPLFTVEEDHVQISFPELKKLEFRDVPKLKCFCSGVYNYDIRLLSIEECPNMRTFPYGNVIINTPNLHKINWDWVDTPTLGDLNLTIYYRHNSEKYKVELQKIETFRDVDKELLGYIKREARLDIVNCHKLNCIPSNMMDLFSHVKDLRVEECNCIEEIFESNQSMLLHNLYLSSLPKLKHLWKNHGHILGFKCLRGIIIKHCNDLVHVFPDVSLVTSLPNLDRIDVFACEKMKEIIGNNCAQQKAKIKFPHLTGITLENLPSLECFHQSSFPCYVEMPHCMSISITNCPEMKTFWHDGILYTPMLPYSSVDSHFEYECKDINEMILRVNEELYR
ncbi:uncharacterized protein LOC123888231 isoform X1 [Trifolium pratense]|nr:uncharacterized protein LOC123888231 isoform X1 [Trifolium pratense]